MKSVSKTRRGVKLSADEILRRLRLGELRKLFADRCRGSVLPDDDAGRDYLRELLLPISIGSHEAVKRPGAIQIWGPTDRMRREIELRAPWMSEDETEELLLEINLMPTWQRKPKAGTLGERLNVPYGERQRLGLRTIGPCDMTEGVMALIRKQKKRRQDKERRQRQPRAEYLAASLAQTKPWEQKGISRATWYRQQRETGMHHINLTKTERTLVSSEAKSPSANGALDSNSCLGSSLCVRFSTATPAGQAETYVTMSEMDWLGWTPELAAEVAKRADTDQSTTNINKPIVVTNYDAALGLMASKGKFMSRRERAA